MTSFRLRPRFRHFSQMPPEAVQSHLQAHLDAPHAPCVSQGVPGFVVLKIPEPDRHYWSPQLTLTLEPEGEGTLIRGLYGPNPTVWTMFMFAYIGIGTLALFVAIIGFSRVNLGLDAPILWALPILGGLALALYIVAQMGQKTGAEQTFRLHHFYEEALGAQVHVH